MAVGDTWIAKQINDGGNLIITVHCYRPDGSLADQFVIDEPSDAMEMSPADYWPMQIIAANNVVVVVSGNYVYTRDVNGAFHSYKYGTDEAVWFVGFNNGQFYFGTVYYETHEDLSTYPNLYRYGHFFTSTNGVNWILRQTGSTATELEIPGILWNVNYDATNGYYYVTAETEKWPLNAGITYADELMLYRTTNFVNFEALGTEDDKYSWYDLNIENGVVRYISLSAATSWNVLSISEVIGTTITTLPLTPTFGATTVSYPPYGSVLVDLDGVPYIITTTTVDIPNYYLWKRNLSGTAYEKTGSAFLLGDVSNFWTMSNYRVYNPTWGYVTLEYHNAPGSVRVVSTNESGFVIPLDNSENWHCCYLETGADFDAPFWCEYDDCAEEPSDYVGAS